MRLPASFAVLLAFVACHRDDPAHATPDEHGTGPAAQEVENAPEGEHPCLSHGSATGAGDYEAIARRITRRIAALSNRFPALDGLDVDDLVASEGEQPGAMRFDLRFAHDVAWDKPQGASPGKLKSMQPTYENDDAIDLSISFFTGPDMGRLMVPLVAIGAMNAKLMVVSPRADEVTAAIRAILVDEAHRFATCT